jgi:hypothetical protein
MTSAPAWMVDSKLARTAVVVHSPTSRPCRRRRSFVACHPWRCRWRSQRGWRRAAAVENMWMSWPSVLHVRLTFTIARLLSCLYKLRSNNQPLATGLAKQASIHERLLLVSTLCKAPLHDSSSLPSAADTRQSLFYTQQRLCLVLHSAKRSRQSVFAECHDLLCLSFPVCTFTTGTTNSTHSFSSLTNCPFQESISLVDPFIGDLTLT